MPPASLTNGGPVPAARAGQGRPPLWSGLWAGFLLALLLYFLYFHALAGVGLLGPDEPRYAAIGREMARSGDWITPRLWGEPWFEKPALLYWMTGAAFRAGLSPDLAPRLPVALLGAGFLVFYFWVLRREFGARAALFATAILGTSAAWLGYSHVGVTDLPLAAAFSAAMLLMLARLRDPSQQAGHGLTAAAALLGLAVLAKGLVPLVLALPLVWAGRRHLKQWLKPAPLAAFLITATPWYVLCTFVNGPRFLEDFFLRHHLGRFASDALQHEQPFWFYAPVLLAGLFPWTPLAALLFRRKLYEDARRRYLLSWLLFGLLFFSVSLNKLPGYLLPLFPALAALLGIALDEAKRSGWALAASASLLAALPAIAAILPQALLRGITHAVWPAYGWTWLPVLAAAAMLWRLDATGRRELAVAFLAAAMTAGVVWLEGRTFPVLDRTVSARQVWSEIAPLAGQLCIERASRSWTYNLNYYSVQPLPDCSDKPRRFRIQQEPGKLRLIDGGQ